VIELDWRRSNAPEAADRSFRLWIDGVSATQLTGSATTAAEWTWSGSARRA
jgi:hypothetical protein